MSHLNFSLLPTSSYLFLLSTLMLLTVGCGESVDDAEGEVLAEDAVDASFATGGKADGAGATDCQVQTLLTQLNGPLAKLDDLKGAGVHTRAAKSISAFVLGPDTEAGTMDDGKLLTLEQLDKLKYVGPAALRQMLSIPVVDQATCGSTQITADVIFSPQPSNATHLVRVANAIDNATTSLDIAMYSFSNQGIFKAIEDAIGRGVVVRVVFEPANKDKSDPQGTMSARLEDAGADVRYINKIMHHKFVIIDGPRASLIEGADGTLISGSGNWSNSAGTRYDENTVFVQGSHELNLRFQREFNRLWDHSRDLVWGTPKTWEKSTLTIEDADIPNNPDIDVAFTSANFRTFTSSRFGETFSRVRGRDEVANFIVAQIEAATSSILVASGHLRSRPIAEALIKKRQDNPNIEILVYLDGQEFISEFWHDKQTKDLQTCIDNASTEIRKQDCIDKGFYFGFALKEAGIDVRYKAYSYRWHYKTAAQMHHKYMIFDRSRVIQGSYNLSDNAEHNTMENMVLFSGAPFASLAQSYVGNFESMWDTGRAQDLLGDLNNTINQEAPGGRIPIVFDSMALTWAEFNDLKQLIRTTCPLVNSDDYRKNPEKHFTCKLPN